MFNAMDMFIIIAFLAIIGLGFFNGVTRVTAALIAIYFGAVFAAAFYRPLTNVVRSHVVTMGRETGYLVFFLLLLFLFSSAFTVIISRWLSDFRLPRRVEILDNIGGAALGVVVSGLATTLAAMLLAITLQALNQTFDVAGRDAVVGFVRNQIDGSTLVPIFLDLAPFFTKLLAPWFPGGLPPILSGGVSQG
ncbi:MAG: hypothetical protein C4346_16075 [Chloroflexota bacterium]